MQKNPLRSARGPSCVRILLALALLAAPLGAAPASLADEPDAAIQAEDGAPIALPPESPRPDGFAPAGVDEPSPEATPQAPGGEASSLYDAMLSPNAYDAQRTEAHPFSRLGLFAGSRGFRMGREDPTYDVEGGASFRFFENFFLTGSYRILDYEFDAKTIEIQNAGPLFGVMLLF